MVFLNGNHVYRVMVITGHKSKASLLATASVSHDFGHWVFPHCSKSLLGDVLQHLLGYNSSLFSVKWAPGLRECSLDTALSGPTAFPSTCVALPSWLRPLLHSDIGDNPKASGQSEHPHCSGWLLRITSVFQSSDLWGTGLSGRLTQTWWPGGETDGVLIRGCPPTERRLLLFLLGSFQILKTSREVECVLHLFVQGHSCFL